MGQYILLILGKFLFYVGSSKIASSILQKDIGYYLEQILEVAPHKTATLQPLTTHLTNHQFWALLVK